MSKIIFDDHSYIEAIKLNDKIIITIAANDNDKPLSMIINSSELTIEQFMSLTKEVMDN